MPAYSASRQITIREVSGEVLDALRAEAVEHGRSLNAVARAALEEHVERRRRRRALERRLPAIEASRRRIAERLGQDLEDGSALIREDRER